MSKVPKLRFKEFSGEWEEKKLNDVGLITTGSTPSTSISEYYGGERLFVSPVDIQGNRYINKTKTTLTELGFSKGRKVVKDSVCFVCIGSTIGKVAQLAEDSLTNQQINCITANNKNFNDFIYSLLELKASKIKLLAGEQALPQINKSDFSKLKFYLPSLQEQEKIASFLISIDKKIEQLTKQEQLLQQYKKGVMQKIFNQEIRFKADDGSEFCEWEEKKLGEISDVRDGTHDSPKYHDIGYPLITSKNLLTNGNIDFVNINLILEEDYINVNKRSKVNIGDILFGMIGTIGNPVIVKQDGFAIKNVALIKEKEILLNNFLIHYLKSSFIEKQFYEQNTGGTQKFIALGIIRELIIILPCLTEQTKIANFLSSIDKKIELTTKELNSTKEFKKALLQQMFI